MTAINIDYDDTNADWIKHVTRRASVKAFDPAERRDDHGRWTRGGGTALLDTDTYTPGQWHDADPADWQRAQLTRTFQKLVDSGFSAMNPTSVDELVDRELAKTTPPKWVRRNGPVTIVNYTGPSEPDAALADLGGTVDLLMAKDPKDEMLIGLDHPMQESRRDSEAAFSLVGDSQIMMKSRLFGGDSHGWMSWMQASQHVTPASYVLAHEWGHAISTEGNSGRQMKALMAKYPGNMMSLYGQTSGDEAYAEAYAEWRLSEGKPLAAQGMFASASVRADTIPNELVIAAAKKFGWQP